MACGISHRCVRLPVRLLKSGTRNVLGEGCNDGGEIYPEIFDYDSLMEHLRTYPPDEHPMYGPRFGHEHTKKVMTETVFRDPNAFYPPRVVPIMLIMKSDLEDLEWIHSQYSNMWKTLSDEEVLSLRDEYKRQREMFPPAAVTGIDNT